MGTPLLNPSDKSSTLVFHPVTTTTASPTTTTPAKVSSWVAATGTLASSSSTAVSSSSTTTIIFHRIKKPIPPTRIVNSTILTFGITPTSQGITAKPPAKTTSTDSHLTTALATVSTPVGLPSTSSSSSSRSVKYIFSIDRTNEDTAKGRFLGREYYNLNPSTCRYSPDRWPIWLSVKSESGSTVCPSIKISHAILEEYLDARNIFYSINNKKTFYHSPYLGYTTEARTDINLQKRHESIERDHVEHWRKIEVEATVSRDHDKFPYNVSPPINSRIKEIANEIAAIIVKNALEPESMTPVVGNKEFSLYKSCCREAAALDEVLSTGDPKYVKSLQMFQEASQKERNAIIGICEEIQRNTQIADLIYEGRMIAENLWGICGLFGIRDLRKMLGVGKTSDGSHIEKKEESKAQVEPQTEGNKEGVL